MPKDPLIAVCDCLTEIAVLHEIAECMTLDLFKNDAIARRAAALQLIRRSHGHKSKVSATESVMSIFGSTMPSYGKS